MTAPPSPASLGEWVTPAPGPAARVCVGSVAGPTGLACLSLVVKGTVSTCWAGLTAGGVQVSLPSSSLLLCPPPMGGIVPVGVPDGPSVVPGPSPGSAPLGSGLHPGAGEPSPSWALGR